MRLIVTVTGIEPGAPLDAATALADELDARRVPLTLLVGPRPHPEVVAWAAARRRAGDAALLHGTGAPGDGRLPAHEAGLRLAGALRARDALGLPVDGFAAPGWAVSAGLRRALGAATTGGVSVLVDADGVHRLDAGGVARGSCAGPVVAPEAPVRRPAWPSRARRRHDRPVLDAPLRHVSAAAAGGPRFLEAIDAALAAGALPTAPGALVPARPTTRRDGGGHPELWSMTA